MNVNILKPGKAVESCFEKPNIVLALVLALLPSLFYIGVGQIFGVQLLGKAVYEIVLGYVRFFAIVLVVLAIGLLLDRAKAKGKVAGLFSALSLLSIVQVLFILVSAAFLPLMFSPEAMDFAKSVGQRSDEAIVAAEIDSFIAENPEAVNFTAFGVFAAIGIALLLWSFYLLYASIQRFAGVKPWIAIVMALIVLTIMGALPI